MIACRSCGVQDCLDLHDVPVDQCKLRSGSKCSPCTAIEALDVEIEAAKATLARLFKKRFSLSTERNREHDSFARLPPEIISKIFSSCVPDEPYPFLGWASPNPLFQKGEIPVALLLGSVSTRWRDISRSTPQLWTYVKINIEDPNSLESAKRFREWLARSGDLPVSITVYMKRHSSCLSTAYTKPLPDSSTLPLIETINEISNRWGTLEAHIPTDLISKLCGNGLSTTLDSLRLIPTEWRIYRRVPNTFTMRNVRPAPTQISLRGLSLHSMDVDWTNLAYIEGYGFRLDECLLVLQQSPRLVRCNFEDVGQRDSTGWHDQVQIVHKSVRWLCLDDRNNMDDFFDVVSLPSLFYLAFSAGYQPAQALESVTSFIKRSGCSLNTLRITNGDLQEAPIIPLLEATPELYRLELSTVALSDTLFQHLGETVLDVYNGEDNAFLPDLDSIDFFGVSTFSWPSVAAIYAPCDTDDSSDGVYRRECSLRIAVYGFEPYNVTHYIDDANSAILRELISERGVDLRITDSQSQRSLIKDLELVMRSD
ncbi:hypothetical protein NLJ89_g10545 [Agrocybe chaxingu]|uniref:F-box domain-containing protein n=1 Tax=Agrocybe chaxingu TaxID=84603 RepID=A0A9W8JXY4_9AGAR|nr:hypothetical protein NLJ89_g10545 [Agrocybe chaxingu]